MEVEVVGWVGIEVCQPNCELRCRFGVGRSW